MCKAHWFLLALNTHTSEVVQKWWGSLCGLCCPWPTRSNSVQTKLFCVKPGFAFSFKKCIVQWLVLRWSVQGKKNLQKNKEMAKNHEYYWINNQIMEQASLQNKEIKRFYVLPHAHMARIICKKCCWRVLLKILAYLLYTLYLFSKF